MADAKVSFSLTDTHGDKDPSYSLEIKLQDFDSPESLIARLDQLRETVAVRYQQKFAIGLTIDNDEEAILRLKPLRDAIAKSKGCPDDVSSLCWQLDQAIDKAGKKQEGDHHA